MGEADSIEQAWSELSPEAQALVGKVVKIEKGKLHMARPHGIYDELLNAVEEVVPEEEFQ